MGLSLVDGRAGPVTWRLLRQAHLRKLEGDAEDSLLGVVRGFETENGEPRYLYPTTTSS